MVETWVRALHHWYLLKDPAVIPHHRACSNKFCNFYKHSGIWCLHRLKPYLPIRYHHISCLVGMMSTQRMVSSTNGYSRLMTGQWQRLLLKAPEVVVTEDTAVAPAATLNTETPMTTVDSVVRSSSKASTSVTTVPTENSTAVPVLASFSRHRYPSRSRVPPDRYSYLSLTLSLYFVMGEGVLCTLCLFMIWCMYLHLV